MEIKVYKPASPLLQEHIECFYTLTRVSEDAPATYLTFPGLQQVVCLYGKTLSEITDDFIVIRDAPNGVLESRIVGKFQKTVCIRYEGKINEITTLFKPLAINFFLPQALKELATGHFSSFDPYPDFMKAMQDIHSEEDIASKLSSLEEYWISKYRRFVHPFLPYVLKRFYADNMDELSLTDICGECGISRQTLHQHFERYLCKTPSEFRKVVRFRKAMKRFKLDPDTKGLSQLSALSSYFDQSHMIRDFKALTGYTPRNFFSCISSLGNGEVNLLFLSA